MAPRTVIGTLWLLALLAIGGVVLAIGYGFVGLFNLCNKQTGV